MESAADRISHAGLSRRDAVIRLGAGGLGLALAARAVSAGAQDATPAADEVFIASGLPVGVPVEALPGLVAHVLNSGMPAAIPSHNLLLYRLTVAPGAFLPDHIHPGTTNFSVEAGTLRWTLHRGTVWVTRAAPEGAPGAAPPERVTEPGTVIELEPGDGLFYNDDVVHTAENIGDEPAVLIVALLFEADQPPITITDEQGTPIPAGTPAG